MTWFFIAVINPILHAAVNHIDKHLLERYFKGREVGALVLFSALFAVIALPFIWLIDRSVLSLPMVTILFLMLNGAFLVFAYIFYFHALFKDEASYVAPFFQLIPVLGFILGYFILGESLQLNQLLGAAVIVVGGIILSIEIGDRKLRFKKKVALLMLASSLCYALNGVVFKLIAVEQGFWLSLFWDFAGKVVFGLLIFALVTSYRREFMTVIRENSAAVLALNGINELLALLGEGTLVFAVLLAPVALVQTVGSIQPLFVFLFGVALTLFWPQFGTESLKYKHLTQKIAGTVLIVVGGVWMV